MTNKQIFLIVVTLFLVCIFIVSNRSPKIISVVDGATVEISNGAYITLLGLDPTIESKEYLESLKGEKVKVVPDGTQYFNVRDMEEGTRYPAYLLLKKGGNISSRILASGYSLLNEAAPLNDSLQNFRRWASLAENANPTIRTRIIDYEKDNIYLPEPPSPVQKSERRHSTWYVDGNLNIEMLEDACDYNLPYTKTFANKLASKSAGSYNFGQVCEIFDYCYNKWSYVNDPADIEYVARASESIAASLSGDCDDFAVLMASCIIAIGGRPCINVGYNSSGGHAFTEVDISQWDESEVINEVKRRFSAYNISSLSTRRDGEHLWLNLDWQASYPGGEYYDCSSSRSAYPYLNGRWTWEPL